MQELNLIPQGHMPVVHVSQYDVGREFQFHLLDGDKEYSESLSMTWQGCKPDGKAFSGLPVTWSSTSSTATLKTTKQSTAVAGRTICEIIVVKSGVSIGTLNFILDVEKSPLDGAIQSDSDIAELKQVIESVEDAKEAADYIDSKVNDALIYSNQAANSANAAKNSASAADRSASTAYTSMLNAQTYKDTAKTYMNNAEESKNSAATSASNAKASETAAANSASKAETMKAETEELKNQAAGYAGAAAYSFMVDSEGYICLNYKEATS